MIQTMFQSFLSIYNSFEFLKNTCPNYSMETVEKRKSTKRALKSEKELLEFSMKYQQVLAERDAGMLQ
ncbi:hypothetical protein Lalb_Chr02g0142021 [Lupinus albus]|uniref:Uncharacterized protein n=1 Tax=Lupinus albus TaxID=3870 RepID=A0A6A4QY47_LUPAL|nr:hypothetical protein Lalb_Chr02g0142021 [Lupinus albus]